MDSARPPTHNRGMTSVRCYVHPDMEGITSCFGCLKPICNACSHMDKLHTVCSSCALSRRRARKVKGIAAAVFGVVAVAGGAFGLSQLEPPFDYGEHKYEVKKLKDLVDKEPCDRPKNLELAKLLNRAGDYRGTLDYAGRFFAECGDWYRLRWETFHAHKQLSEFDRAVAEATRLVEHEPEDQDYWWWRGEMYAELGDWEKAAFDFQQCVSLLPTANYCPFDLADALEKLGRHCDAIFPIEQYRHYHPKWRDDARIKARIERYIREGKCDVGAEGRAVIRFDPNTGGVKARVKVNGKEGTFLVDTGASYLTLSKRFADQLGVLPTQQRTILLKSATGVHAAHLSVVDLVEVKGTRSKGVQAKRVDAAIMDNLLDDDIDGLLGLSFLSRFDLEWNWDKGQLVIEAR